MLFLTKSGKLYNFDTSDAACGPFGFVFGDSVLTCDQRHATVIGVQNRNLWMLVEGDAGASFWGTCKSKQDFATKGFELATEPHIVYLTKSGKTYQFDTSKEACQPFGFSFRQVVKTSSGKPAVVIGVYDQNIWFQVEGDHGASYWSSCRKWRDFHEKGFQLLAETLGSFPPGLDFGNAGNGSSSGGEAAGQPVPTKSPPPAPRAHNHQQQAQPRRSHLQPPPPPPPPPPPSSNSQGGGGHVEAPRMEIGSSSKPTFVRFVTKSGKEHSFDIREEALQPWGLSHGDRVMTSSGKEASVVGVHDGNLWFHVEGDSGASYWSSLTCKEDLDARGFRKLERDSASARRHVVERPLKTGEMGSFDTRRESCKVFGFEAGERVMTPTGKVARVVGVYRGRLWFELEGESGALYFDSCNTASDFAQKGFRSVDADASEPKILHFHTRSGNPTEFDISDAACLPFGFRHGETIITDKGKRSVVVGVSKNNLWLLLEGDPGASYWSSLRQKSDFDSRGFRSCPENPMTAVFSLDWYTLGAAENLAFPEIVARDGLVEGPHARPKRNAGGGGPSQGLPMRETPLSSPPVRTGSTSGSSSTSFKNPGSSQSTPGNLHPKSKIEDLLRYCAEEFGWDREIRKLAQAGMQERYIRNLSGLSHFAHKSHDYMNMPETLWELIRSVVFEIIPNPALHAASGRDETKRGWRSVEELREILEEVHKSNDTIANDTSLEIPEDFLDPVTSELMQDPVVAADGRTYERAAVELWLRDHDTSPYTGAKLDHNLLIPNYNLKSLITTFIQDWENRKNKKEDAADSDEEQGGDEQVVGPDSTSGRPPSPSSSN